MDKESWGEGFKKGYAEALALINSIIKMMYFEKKSEAEIEKELIYLKPDINQIWLEEQYKDQTHGRIM